MERKKRALYPAGWIQRVKEKENLLAAFLMTMALFLPIALRYDFYYDLNDDVLIKDILSGVYTGTPEGRTMQLLYPLGLCLSLLYRVLAIPVFGVFLELCQFGSIFLIGYETACCLDRCAGRPLFAAGKRVFFGLRLGKLLVLAAEGVFFAAAFGRHLVFVQYTVAAGMLAGAAIFRFLTVRKAGPGMGAFLRCHGLTLALYWLAFCLRSEMALLLLPLAAVAGLCRWGRERAPFSWENLRNYLICFGLLIAGCVCLASWDSFAYRGADWKSFRRFFDARTELYDYHLDFINDYEANENSYQAAGVKEIQQTLLENYNFGADDGIDTDMLETLEREAARRDGTGGLFRKSLREGIWDLVYGHWLGKRDLILNAALLFLGILSVLLCLLGRRLRFLWQAPLALAVGSTLWLFLLLRDRPVDRVLHPLYLAQILLYAGLVFLEAGHTDGRMAQNGPEQAGETGLDWLDKTGSGRLPQSGPALGTDARKGRRTWAGQENAVCSDWLGSVSLFVGLVGALLLLGFGLFQLPKTAASVRQEYDRRETVNAVNRAVADYCSAHPGRLFLEDVYSTVDFSEKIAADKEKPFNYDLLGGWLVKSPLTGKKLAAFGFSSMGEAVRSGPPVSLVCSAASDLGWLEALFEQEGLELRVLKTGEITEGVNVYQVLPKETGNGLQYQSPE